MLKQQLAFSMAMIGLAMAPTPSFAADDSDGADYSRYDNGYPSVPASEIEYSIQDEAYYNDWKRGPAKVARERMIVEEEGIEQNMPQNIPAMNEKVIIVNPSIYSWGAYDAQGRLIRSGRATSGAAWCNDIDRPCKTTPGTFRIQRLGNEDCISNTYPLGEGGAPMPYCMFFNGGQGLHGSGQVVANNLSHGCVRLHVGDARWLRYNFANIGTKVVIKTY